MVWSIGNADGVWCVHSAVQHSNFVNNRSFQERPLLHQSHSLVQLVLEVVVSTVTFSKAIICVEVPTNMSGATARDVLAFSTCVRDELVNIVEAHSHKWSGQIFEAFGNDGRCSFFPHADLSCNTLGVVPTIWQRLGVVHSTHRPVPNPCGVTVGPAVAMPLCIWFTRALRSKQVCNWTVPRLNFGIGARCCASSHHVTHATADDVGLVCTQENVRHLSWTPTACRIQKTHRVSFTHIFIEDRLNTPLLRHEQEVF